MTQRQNTIVSTRAAKAVTISRAMTLPAALTNLIFSVLLGLLSGAVWMHAT